MENDLKLNRRESEVLRRLGEYFGKPIVRELIVEQPDTTEVEQEPATTSE